ncbi:hypothetical protein VN12_03000 [Pirellula sp. SH-Sr6A]|nr:hypothetical protein VN12_03000 [Pirellula sp. SH-Sr6A]
MPSRLPARRCAHPSPIPPNSSPPGQFRPHFHPKPSPPSVPAHSKRWVPTIALQKVGAYYCLIGGCLLFEERLRCNRWVPRIWCFQQSVGACYRECFVASWRLCEKPPPRRWVPPIGNAITSVGCLLTGMMLASGDQSIPRSGSFSIKMLRSALDKSFWSRRFSFSRSLRRLDSSSLIPPYPLRQRGYAAAGISNACNTTARSFTALSLTSASCRLAMICSVGRRYRCLSLPH